MTILGKADYEYFQQMSEDHNTQIKLKPWGKEIWFAHTNKYAGKILEVKKGHRYSLQYHESKQETQYLYKGKVKFTYGTDKDNLKEIILEPGDKIDVHPGTIHRLEALEDSQIFEVSTPELHDVVKIHDDYGRSGSGNDEDQDHKLHHKNH
ncbi:cupin [Patescibacteria group bacterium]